MTNTETEKRPKTTGRAVVSRIISFVITLIFILVLAVNLQLIFRGSTEFAPITYVVVSALYLIADSVRAGINMAVANLPIHASQGTDED